jgi:flavin-dependent dehydrogenase
MEYAILASEAIVEAFANKDFSFSKYKDAVINSRMGQEKLRNLQYAKGLYGPGYVDTMPKMLAALKKTDTLEKLRI